MEGQVKRSKFFVHIVYCEMHGQPCDLGPTELFICLFFWERGGSSIASLHLAHIILVL